MCLLNIDHQNHTFFLINFRDTPPFSVSKDTEQWHAVPFMDMQFPAKVGRSWSTDGLHDLLSISMSSFSISMSLYVAESI
jgi:hypothetical protein